jgi:glutathione S-transferase
MTTLYVPTGFSYVAASLLSLTTVLQWQAIAVGGARKKARIAYPQAYADKAEQESSNEAKVFNCMQRAHQNTLENVPVIVLMTLISGFRYPIAAAAACGLWTVTRIMYTLRYGTGEPKKRALPVRLSFFVQTTLSILSGKVVFDLIKAGV